MIDQHRMVAKEEGEVPRVPEEEYVENIRAYAARAQEFGAKIMFFGFPLEREGYTAGHRAILHSASELMRVPLYDPQPEFERWSASESLFFPEDRGHANEEGLARIATGMAQFLVAEKLIP